MVEDGWLVAYCDVAGFMKLWAVADPGRRRRRGRGFAYYIHQESANEQQHSRAEEEATVLPLPVTRTMSQRVICSGSNFHMLAGCFLNMRHKFRHWSY